MPYTAPTPSDIKARFPEFSDVADVAVEFAIQEALLSVDDSWVMADYATAIAYLAAHILSAHGYPGTAGSLAQIGPVTSESLGDASMSFAQKAQVVGVSGLAAELATSVYGQRFLRLQTVNHPAVALC